MEGSNGALEIRLVESPFHCLKILIVEDQPESRVLLRKMLEEMGVREVFEVDDGRSGLRIMGNGCQGVDIILCDWNMPMINGIEFLREVRAGGIQIPFIMITGRGDQNSVMEARRCGVDGFIRKPYISGQIEAKLRIILQRTNRG